MTYFVVAFGVREACVSQNVWATASQGNKMLNCHIFPQTFAAERATIAIAPN
jgi:hypothetical protein